jgi:glycosyltransferase involved in cell wall biosynthesis
LYQGRYAPERGLENLVRAAHHLLPDIGLVFRGYGPIEGELRALASGTKNVRFVQPVPMEQLVDAARDADVGIVSYLSSNLNNYLASPNKLFEYIHAGLPVAASDIPFIRKVVCENDIGAVFDPKDPLSIAESLNRVTRPRELLRHRKRIIAAAKKYSWQVEEKKLLRTYARLRDQFRRESGLN